VYCEFEAGIPPPPPSLTYHLNGCKAKGSLGPIWDHLKLLCIERQTVLSFLFFSFSRYMRAIHQAYMQQATEAMLG